MEKDPDRTQLPLRWLTFVEEITQKFKRGILSRSESLEINRVAGLIARIHLDKFLVSDHDHHDTQITVCPVVGFISPSSSKMKTDFYVPLHNYGGLSQDSRFLVLILNSRPKSSLSDNVVKILNSFNCCDKPGMTRSCHCTCGKCSHTALFEHTCPQAYQSLSPFLQNTTLISSYFSAACADSFILPVDNWWNVQLCSAISTSGSQSICLLLSSQESSSCDGEQCFHNCLPTIIVLSSAEMNPALEKYFISKKSHIAALQKNSNSGYSFLQTEDVNTAFHTTNPEDLANLVLLLQLLAGDIETNPGPGSGNNYIIR